MNTPRPIVSIRNISKSFAGAVVAVDDVSLEIGEGEFFALLGPSGCGKTTLLRILAGLEIPQRGEVLIDGKDMTGVPPNRRPVNMVFQSYAVFPHLSVFNNVAYGLKVTAVAAAEIQRRVKEALELVRLDGLDRRMPEQLSGGQRQRVALARALVKRPRVLLLDEPLSALDARLREAMQVELVKLQHAVGITFIIVTHDQHEALSMANRIAVMESGKVRQVAPPDELYEYPGSRFVADFIGKMNLFEGVARKRGSHCEIEIEALGTITLEAALGRGLEGVVGVAVRPEKIKLLREAPSADYIAFESTIGGVIYQGGNSQVLATTTSGVEISVTVQNTHRDAPPPARGERVWCAWRHYDTVVLK